MGKRTSGAARVERAMGSGMLPWRAVLWLAWVVLASCGGDGGDGPGGGGSGGRVGIAGGTLRGPDGALVVVPPGAVDGDFQLTIATVGLPSPPLGGSLLSTPLRLTPKAQTFAAPVELTITVPTQSAPAGAALTGIVVLRGDADANIWVPVPAVSGGAGAVTAQTDQLGDFAAVVSTSISLGACGDTMCGAGEGCVSCPLDCGLCLTGGHVSTPGGESPLVVSADGTATDMRNGLVWERHPSVASGTHADAIAACAASTLAGRTWRLPSVREALSLYDRARTRVPLWWVGVDGLTSGGIWTDTVSPFAPTTDAFTYDASTGTTNTDAFGALRGARCVSGPAQTGAALVDNLDGTITDTVGRLDYTQARSPTGLTFADAQAYCAALTTAGGGFRLPSIDELLPIIDFTRSLPPVDPGFFPGWDNSGLWTTTAVPFGSGWRYYFWMIEGELLQVTDTNNQSYAVCVR